MQKRESISRPRAAVDEDREGAGPRGPAWVQTDPGQLTTSRRETGGSWSVSAGHGLGVLPRLERDVLTLSPQGSLYTVSFCDAFKETATGSAPVFVK